MGHQERCISAIHWLETSGALALLGWVSLLAVIRTPAAQAQTYEVLFDLKGGADGSGPTGLIGDPEGDLYGTTYGGGIISLPCCPEGCGVVFRLDKTGETVLYRFTGGTDGTAPGSLIRDPAGNLYGITYWGGAFSGELYNDNSGTVFKVDTTGKKTVLHNFGGTPGDGTAPTGLIRDAAGNLYGVTEFGGTGWGVVFKLDRTGVETVLHAFAGYPTDGGDPVGLLRDSAGNFYGVTAVGGTPSGNAGVVYKLDPTGHETILYGFTGGSDGGSPSGSLVLDPAGNLYGATIFGGAAPEGETSGYGVVFKLDATGHETVLYTFSGGADGGQPMAGLIGDSAGNLYGTTSRGGTTSTCTNGCGIIFRLDQTGKETVLRTFTGNADGAYPLIRFRGPGGNLYGFTDWFDATNFGQVFELQFAVKSLR
jgi:uncharacterized repeat protein (TIGR03803 family)